MILFSHYKLVKLYLRSFCAMRDSHKQQMRNFCVMKSEEILCIFASFAETKFQKIMKQVYLLIIALLFPVSMWADDVTIPLYDISKGA